MLLIELVIFLMPGNYVQGELDGVKSGVFHMGLFTKYLEMKF